MNVLDLFSGIGGFSLGLERAGMHTVAFCETDKFCRGILAKHWPGGPIYGDIGGVIRELEIDDFGRKGDSGEPAKAVDVNVVCGGFP